MRRISSSSGCASATTTSIAVQRGSFFFGKKNDNGTAPPASSSSSSTSSPPKGFDVGGFQQFLKSTPEQQLDMMQKAANMQRTMGKVPGLGLLARKNADMMDRMIKMQRDMTVGKPVDPAEKQRLEQEARGLMAERGVDPEKAAVAVKSALGSSQPPPPPRFGGSSSARGASSGPSLDELKKVNLGTEIEALFQELKSVRESKNSYRDKFNAREKECDELQKEAQALRDTSANLRSKLQLAETNVLLLNSESMTLKDEAKLAKDLQRQNSLLNQKITLLQHNDTQPLLARIQELEAALRTKEAHEQSLHRKLDRTRRRDPLLQFTSACSTGPLQLCRSSDDSGETEGRKIVDDAFQSLRSTYDDAQQQAWSTAVAANGGGAKLMVAAARELIASWLGSKGKLDATVHVGGSDEKVLASTLKSWRDVGFTVEKDTMSEGKYVVSSPSSATTPSTLGPYGVIAAAMLARSRPTSSSSSRGTTDTIISVAPCISSALLNNSNRAKIDYESCRSGGPGGQAANVSETQINAKLSIDGVFLYKTEAQDSRSALANKESATEKLVTTHTKHWNDRSQRFDPNRLIQEIADATTSAASFISSSYGSDELSLLDNAAQNQQIAHADVEVVQAVEAIRAVVSKKTVELNVTD